MGTLQSKRFDEPDELITLPLLTEQVVFLGEVHVARSLHQPGWSWAEHVKPVVGTTSCLHHHQGVLLSGQVEVETDAGARRRIVPGEAFEIPPGHDARVIGDEPAVTIEFAGRLGQAHGGWRAGGGDAPRHRHRRVDCGSRRAGGRGLEGAPGAARRPGSRPARSVSGLGGDDHGRRLLAMFDGAARAVRCAAAIRDTSAEDGLPIRAGVHSGEVERHADNIRGVAVHTVTRIAALAQPGEVLVSATAVSLLEGSDLPLVDADEHELKGIPGRRQVYRLGK